MGTPIAGKPHTSPLVGTEKIPLSPDGFATTQEVADLADAFDYIQESDPGAVGAFKTWVQTDEGDVEAFWVRNEDDDGWDFIGGIEVSLPGSQGVVWRMTGQSGTVLQVHQSSAGNDTGAIGIQSLAPVGYLAGYDDIGVDLIATRPYIPVLRMQAGGDAIVTLFGTADPTTRAAQNEVQEVTVEGTGTFSIVAGGTTGLINVGDDEAAVQAAFDVISPDLVVSGDWSFFTVTFTGTYAASDRQLMNVATGDDVTMVFSESVKGHPTGLAANVGSTYQRNVDGAGLVGEFWVKTGAADTAWTNLTP